MRFSWSLIKSVIVGEFNSYNGTSRGNIARLETNGQLDGSFAEGAGAWTGEIYSAIRQNDGRIIIGGWFQFYDGIPCGNIARLYPDGTFDPSFNAGTGAEGTPMASCSRRQWPCHCRWKLHRLWWC
ncbi:MAG: delta-60 repeat domain-containing protein [Flavobacteriales bacterium]|nr:delta-60 repeat domain-containing protein [Flavobacteriales bacterium]